MAARILDASNVSLAYPTPAANNAAPYTANFNAFGEGNGFSHRGGNWNSDSIGVASSGLESGLRAINVGTRNTSTYTTGRGSGAYFVPPYCTANSQDIRDTNDGRTHAPVDKVHCTWRISCQNFLTTTGVAHYNYVLLGVYDTASALIAGIRVCHRGESFAFYLEPWLASDNPATTYLGELRNSIGSQDIAEHCTTGGDKYMTVELVVDTTLTSPTSDSTRAAARIVLPTGQAQPWVVQTWDSSDRSMSANACDQWQIWSQDKDATAGAPTYEPYFKLDNYHHVDGADWWGNYDTYGVGHDGFGHGVKIAELKPASDIYQDSSGWTKSAGTTWYGCIDDLPFALADYISCTTTAKVITFGMESFLTKAGWTASPYGEVLGVVPKIYTTFYSATDYYYGTNVRFGLCDGSNATWTQASGYESYGEVATGSSRQLQGVFGWGVAEKPGGGAWAASSIDTDLRLWIKSGTFYNSKYPAVYDACCYVLYREPQRAVGSSSGGQGVLATAPALTRPRVASGAGRDCSRIDTVDTQAPSGNSIYRSWELPTTDSNGVTNNFVFGDYNPRNGKYYACAWDKNLWNNADPIGAGSGRYPCVAEIDPATGTTKIIWSAGEFTTGTTATDGGPHYGASGGWYWQTSGASGNARAMRPHFLKIDKRPKFLDGTANPFYGHMFCTFMDGANAISPPVLQHMGVLWLDPTQSRSGDYCKGRFLPWERTAGDSYIKGALGVCVTEDYVYAIAPLERAAASNSIFHRFNKKGFTSSTAGVDWSGGRDGSGIPSGYPIQDQASDWDVAVDTGTSTSVSLYQHAVNQTYYLGGKVWVTGPVIYGFTPGDSANGDGGGTGLGPWAIKAGSSAVPEFNTRQLTMHPVTGNLWGCGQWSVIGGIGNSRIKDWADTWEASGARTGKYGNDTLAIYEMNPTTGACLRFWRVPLEITDDAKNATASMAGAWRDDLFGDSMSIHGIHWVDENTLVVSLGEHRSSGDFAGTPEWPRSTLMVFRRDDETWHQVTKPARNQVGLILVDALPTDRGRFGSGSSDAPANRHDLMSLGGATEVQDPATWDTSKLRYRYTLVDTGFTRAGNATPDYYTYANDGGATTSSAGHLTEVFLRPPLLRENEVMVEATIDLTGTGITSVDEWHMTLRSGGTVGTGGIFASGGPVTADASNKVRIRGFVQSSEWKPGGSASDIDVFWQVTSSGRKYWNSRSTS